MIKKSNYFQNNVPKKVGRFVIKFKEFNLKFIFNKYKANGQKT